MPYIFVGRQMINSDAILRAAFNETERRLHLWLAVIERESDPAGDLAVHQQLTLTGDVAEQIWLRLQGMGVVLLNPDELGAP